MTTTMKSMAACAAVLLLAACSDSPQKTAKLITTTEYEQLSQLDWSEITAAPTAAKVTNNNLIMMR